MRGQTSSSSSSSSAAPSPPTPAGLVYVTDDKPGFTRIKRGEHFAYRDTDGKPIRDKKEIQRIRQLAIPPAYTQVWICPLRNGHLQATGRDARGRKQYRYHADWREQRDESKFDRMEAFGLALPRIRARVARDLQPRRGQPLGRTVVLATLVRLLDTTFLRVGNDAYARENGSYGLTTLRTPHAGVRGSVLQLRFRGKSGVMQNVKLDDPKVAAVVRRCQQLPGQELFQYEGEDGQPHTLGSSDVNDYLAEIVAGKRAAQEPRREGPPRASDGPLGGHPSTGSGRAVNPDGKHGGHFTAKDFRTWHGTVQALELTRLACAANSATPSSYSAKAVLAEVAGLLGNTPAVCRKSYIHPAVMALGTELSGDPETMGTLWDTLAAGKRPRRLFIAEGRLLAFLKNRRRKVRKKS